MIKYFIHPETKEKLLIEDCLQKGLLSDFFPLSYLHACVSHREWEGKPSTTQLLNGTRMEYLKIFVPYSINPKDHAFMILGTRGHSKLEKLTPQGSIAELSIPESEIPGVADLLEQMPNGEWWLIDHKTWGAYSVKKVLGLVKKYRPAFDGDGNPILYQKSGKWGKAGDQKKEVYYVSEEKEKDCGNIKLQLNNYRKNIEKYYGIKVSRLKAFAIVRDGGTQTAKNYGVEEKTYYIDIPFMDNKNVDKYFNAKKQTLLLHTKSYEESTEKENDKGYKELALFNYMPEMCNDEECWYGKRCQGFCPVSDICAKAGNKYLEALYD